MDNEEPDHDNRSPTSRLVRLPLISVLRDNDGDDDVACRHTDSADGKNGLSAEFVDIENRWNGSEEHDDSNDPCGEEGDGVRAKTEGGEDCGRVVEDCVDAGPLLEEHGDCGDDDTLEHRSGTE